MASGAVLTAALLFGAGAARAGDGDIVTRFGLVGAWAIDCNQGPAGGNPYLVFKVAADGGATRELIMQNKDLDGAYDLTRIYLLSDIHIAFNDRRRGGNSWHDVVMELRDGRLRSIASVSNTGQKLIENGTLIATGQPTLVFQRCPKGPGA